MLKKELFKKIQSKTLLQIWKRSVMLLTSIKDDSYQIYISQAKCLRIDQVIDYYINSKYS